MAKLKELIFKPKWLHKEAGIRARSVALSQDPRLIKLLPEFARDDPDALVRLSAARRIVDIGLMSQLAYGDDDGKVRDYAIRVFRSLMSGDHPDAPAASVRLSFLDDLDDAELIEHLAIKADDAALREQAQSHIEKQGMLGNIALTDPDPKLRQAAARRIQRRSTLERVSRAARKSDKQVYRIVADCLETMQIKAGDPVVIQTRALELCEKVEALARSNQSLDDRVRELDDIRSAWEAVQASTTAEIKIRFTSGCRILELAVSGHAEDPEAQKTAHAIGALESYLVAAEPLSDSDRVEDIGRVQAQIQHGENIHGEFIDHLDPQQGEQLDGVLKALRRTRDQLLEAQPADPALRRVCRQAERAKPDRTSLSSLEKMKSEWDRAWSGLTHPNPSDHSEKNRFESNFNRLKEQLESIEQRRAGALEKIDGLVEQLEAKLDEGILSESAAAKQAVLDALADIGRHPRVAEAEFKARIASARNRLHELRDWQHWANNEVRARLCQHAEAISGTGMHPDAVSQKLRELQARWKALDGSERLPGDPPNRRSNPAMWRRFNSACTKAFNAAKPFFEKRAEIRDKHLEDVQEVLAELDQARNDLESCDVKTLDRLIARARRSLRDMGNIPPAQRKSISRRLRDGSGALDKHLNHHYKEVEQRKQDLIDEVIALSEEQDLATAISATKEAQKRWQSAGTTRRYSEQKLWKAFRAASDAVFSRLDEQRQGERAERQQAMDQLNGLIDEVRELLSRTGPSLTEAPEQLKRIREAWGRVELNDRRLEQTFQGLCEDLRTAAAEAKVDNQRIQHQRQRDLANLCRQAETAVLTGEGDLDALGRQWQIASAEGEVIEAIAARFERVFGGESARNPLQPSEANLDRALQLCIQIEFLAGSESPQEYQEQRMAYQVSRLSERMGGGGSVSPRAEAQQLESDWLTLGALPPQDAGDLDRRFWGAIEQFEKTAG